VPAVSRASSVFPAFFPAFFLALFLALFMCWAGVAFADVAVPPLTGRVVDLTGTLSSDQIAAQSQRLKDLEKRKGSQVAVLIVPTTQPETIEQYSIRVAEAWKIGRKKIDDGALLVVAKDDHKLRIEVGYGLEGALTDVTARRIIDEVIVPQFRFGDFNGGINAGISRIIGVIDGEPLPAPKPEASHGSDIDFETLASFWPFILVGALMIGSFMRAVFGRLLGASVSGGILGAIVWFLVGSLIAGIATGGLSFLFVLFAGNFVTVAPGRGGYGGSYSGGGGGGWSSGSSSSDSGGFSGGGGSFGGGGASGSW
jgi:uncharacterized protein